MCLETVKKDRITILATHHTLFVAHGIMKDLESLGIRASIITSLGNQDYGQLFIVISPQLQKKLPWNYVVYQLEQISSSNWCDEHYIKILRNSLGVIDYSLLNIRDLQAQKLPLALLYFMPVCPISEYPAFLTEQGYNLPPVEKDIDVLFYGAPHSPRRQQYISALKNHFNITIASEVFGEEMVNLVRRAKIVVNIHYYEQALLETTRIFEALSLGAIVVSERSYDHKENASLSNLVTFTPEGDIDAMVKKVSTILETYNDTPPSNSSVLSDLLQQRKFLFARFLLGIGFIPYETFIAFIEPHNLTSMYSQKNPKLCLSLPETLERRNSFLKEDMHDFQIIDGLKHRIPWIGCGLSYKYLFYLAQQYDSDVVTICEDDVYFPSGFKERHHKIYQYLINNKDKWDIFAGVIADLSPKTSITDIDYYDGIDYIYIDRMVSMVYNIYNSTVFDKLSNWDLRITATSNTIDRHIEQTPNLKIVTCYPFLVGHKEELHSSLWGQSNTTYNSMISSSEAQLLEKIERYKTAKGIA